VREIHETIVELVAANFMKKTTQIGSVEYGLAGG
jgi:hypothetical protein